MARCGTPLSRRSSSSSESTANSSSARESSAAKWAGAKPLSAAREPFQHVLRDLAHHYGLLAFGQL